MAFLDSCAQFVGSLNVRLYRSGGIKPMAARKRLDEFGFDGCIVR
jgi:hypothetical protein